MRIAAVLKKATTKLKKVDKGIQLGKPVPGLLEREILSAVISYLTFKGYKVLRLAVQGKVMSKADGRIFVPNSMKGYPDLAVFVQGHTYWLEVKRPGGYLSPCQIKALQTLANYNICCGIVFDAESAFKCIKEAVPGVIWLPPWIDRPKELP